MMAGAGVFRGDYAITMRHPEGGDETRIISGSGMSLRQWYAGQALTRVDWHTVDPSHRSAIAHQCFAMSDAMLAEGEKSDAKG